MRLLNTTTLQLETFDSVQARPTYAILSHTWGDDEILFEDVKGKPPGPLKTKKAARDKIAGSCREAKRQGYSYIWIDTCCIDKSSSSELSEAINSMFKWYSAAAVCFVYLIDVLRDRLKEPEWRELERSRWFKRGWTLQELIAPPHVQFFNRDWAAIGTRESLVTRISDITNIDPHLLLRTGDSEGSLRVSLETTSIATRMSWAAERETTREEDLAYCLLGLFDVNMPLLYGEGKKAFLRLQEQIVKKSNDQSILAWIGAGEVGAFASSPKVQFLPGLSSYPQSRNAQTMTVTMAGLEVDVLLGRATVELTPGTETKQWLAVLNCCAENDFLVRPAILLVNPCVGEAAGLFYRATKRVIWLEPNFGVNEKVRTTAWCEDSSGRRKVTLSVGELKQTSIVLYHHAVEMKREQASPPLYINLAGTHHRYYSLAESKPPAQRNYVPPAYMTPFPLRFRVEQLNTQMLYPIGALYFQSKGNPEASFFVLWGLELSELEISDPSSALGRSWWDDSRPACAVLSWEDVAGEKPNITTEQQAESSVTSHMATSYLLLNYSRQRIHQTMVARGWPSRSQEATVRDGILVRAAISTVDFLDRRGLRLVVEISGAVE